ncbi:MAG: hypothetical protein AB7J32_16100 [Pseudonocardia sp.]
MTAVEALDTDGADRDPDRPARGVAWLPVLTVEHVTISDVPERPPIPRAVVEELVTLVATHLGR